MQHTAERVRVRQHSAHAAHKHTSGDGVGGKGADLAEEGGVVIGRLEDVLRGKN